MLDEDTDPDFHHTVYLLGGNTLFGCTSTGRPRPRSPSASTGSAWTTSPFGCADRAELEQWARRLDGLGIAHGPIKDAGHGSGLSFRDPDGIALEFFAPPA